MQPEKHIQNNTLWQPINSYVYITWRRVIKHTSISIAPVVHIWHFYLGKFDQSVKVRDCRFDSSVHCRRPFSRYQLPLHISITHSIYSCRIKGFCYIVCNINLIKTSRLINCYDFTHEMWNFRGRSSGKEN